MKKTNKLIKPVVLILCGLVLVSIIILIVFLVSNNKGEQVMLSDNLNQIQGLENYEPTGDLAESFGDQVAYEVKNIKWDGDTGKAEVEITTPDLAEIISDSINEAIDEYGLDDYDALLEAVRNNVTSTLNSGKYPTIDNTVEMDAEKTGDGYRLISNEEFERVIAGNLEEIFIQALMEGLANEATK